MTDKANSTTGLTYADAGVDINAGNLLVERIKPAIARTHRPGVLGGFGGFGGLFEIPAGQYDQPVMVSGTDGVGTKLRLAIDLDLPDTIGIDLVAMCVNDILVSGAEPLWFLDYFATGKLNIDQASRVIGGIAEGCVQAGAALLGGETAEMPGMYQHNDYDLGGFAVGVVEKKRIITGQHVRSGDVIIGIHSSGPHSNGYSLIRAVAETRDLARPFADTTLGDTLLTPTRIYVRAVQALLAAVPVKALAHITGGGLLENIPRSLPNGVVAQLATSQWQPPDIFDWIQRSGNISDQEMRRTFNCGIGMTAVVGSEYAAQSVAILVDAGEKATVIGDIIAGEGAPVVEFS